MNMIKYITVSHTIKYVKDCSLPLQGIFPHLHEAKELVSKCLLSKEELRICLYHCAELLYILYLLCFKIYDTSQSHIMLLLCEKLTGSVRNFVSHNVISKSLIHDANT